jgi:hypothetical protein
MTNMFAHQIDCSVEESILTIKNTFVDFNAAVADCAPRRCASAPSSPRGKAALTELFAERLRPLTKKTSSDASTLSCTEDSEEDASSSHMGEAVPTPPPPPADSNVVRTPLRSVLKAKAWTPSAGRDLDTQAVIETVKHRLKGVRSLLSATSEWNACSGVSAGMCTLTLMIAVEACQPVEQVLTQAKHAIFTSVAEVPRLYVMGQRLSPFVQTSQGFAVMVGIVEDPNQACWDAFGKGFCARGTTCHWQHPKLMTHININVVPVQTRAPEAMYMAVPVQMDQYCDGSMMQGYFPADGIVVDEYGNAVVNGGFGQNDGYY